MATTGAAKAKQATLPRSATVTIRNGTATPFGEIEVAPDVGRVHFKNKDDRECRLRFTRGDDDPGIDIVLTAGQTLTISIKRDDVFQYRVVRVQTPGLQYVEEGGGGGTIRN